MADLKKLDKAISELELQANDLKDFNKVYAEISKLKSDITANLETLKSNNSQLEELSKSLVERLENLQKSLATKVDELHSDNKNFYKELDNSLSSRLDKHKSDIQVSIREEGAQIQRGLENVISSKFNTLEGQIKGVRLLLIISLLLGVVAIVMRFI